MLVVETIYLLSRISFLATGLNVTRYNLRSWDTQRLRLPKLPGCPLCRPARNEMGMIEPAVLFEDAVSFPSRHLLDPKGHQMHYRASNLELAHEGKRYPGVEHIALPERSQLCKPTGETLEHLPGHSASVSAPTRLLDIPSLATLLLLSAGIKYTDGNKAHKLQRWSPTGGNLGSVELYIIAHNVAELAPGLYFYQPHEHALALLSSQEWRDGTDALMRQALDLAESEELPDALIVLTAAHHRVLHKYGAFAYRIINLDAGVALGQMHMAASYLGLAARTLPRWADDVLADHLDLEDINEAVTAVCALRGGGQPQEEYLS
jgi:SagB-type dehydrogenase family enzyme